MTERLFLDQPRLQETVARVLSVDAAGVVLDRTVFYARSGGQPGDTGTLRWAEGSADVTEAVKGEGDAILHQLADGTPPLEPGAEVTAAIDWVRRHRLMRMHTTLHLLCAVLPGAAVTGGQIGSDRSRLDFDLSAPPPKEEIEERLNALILKDYAVSTEWVDESVLDTNPNLVRTLSVKPPRGTGRLRLVRIGTGETPVDLQPCGGTHVATTAEIGRVTVQKIENKGRQNRRITLALAEPA
jgi:misacylated tRNA(Ala) deacylase